MKKIIAVSNDKGSRRINENAYYCSQQDNLFILCDGMGGASYGDEAANIVLKSISSFMQHAVSDSEATMIVEKKRGVSTESQYLLNAVNYANNELIKYAKENSKYTEMGASIALVYLSKRYLSLINVGMVSVYLYRNAKIKKLSVDHSLNSYQMLEAIKPEQLIPMLFLGYDENLNIVAKDERVRDGDILVILTPSIDKYLTIDKIASIISLKLHQGTQQELDLCARTLIAESRLMGNTDNATSIIVKNNG